MLPTPVALDALSVGSVVRPARLHDDRHFLLVLASVLAIQLRGRVVRRTVWIWVVQQRLNNINQCENCSVITGGGVGC